MMGLGVEGREGGGVHVSYFEDLFPRVCCYALLYLFITWMLRAEEMFSGTHLTVTMAANYRSGMLSAQSGSINY